MEDWDNEDQPEAIRQKKHPAPGKRRREIEDDDDRELRRHRKRSHRQRTHKDDFWDDVR